MGAQDFIEFANGDNMAKAFNEAVEQAAYDYGHSGYTGSIAEKSDFIEYRVDGDLTDKEAMVLADRLMNLDDPDPRIAKFADKIDDKWGPAGGFRIRDGFYGFVGWASS